MSKPIVVIGSGLAGYLFAKEFRLLDKKRPLVIVTNSDGRFYSKPLLSTALTHQKSIEALAISDAQSMAEKLSVKIITHAEVIAINSTLKTISYQDADGEHPLAYGDLVLACGAEKISLPLEESALENVQSVNTIEDYEQFRDWVNGKKHIGIIGAGFVGCEFANDLLNANCKVSVIASVTHPLARLIPEKAGQVLQNALAEKGVQWSLGHFVKDIEHHDNVYRIMLDNGVVIEVDGVMSAVGIRPKLNLAKSAGIKTNRGIVVDSQLRSSDPNIFALGDCAEVNGKVLQYVAPIIQSSRVLAKVLAQEEAILEYPVMPIVIKTPACPLVIVPVPNGIKGQWFYEGENNNVKAIFKDESNNICGFVLLGNTVRDKINLIKQYKKN